MSGWYGERSYNSECYGGYESEALWAEDHPEGYRSYCRAAGDTWAQEKGIPAGGPVVASDAPPADLGLDAGDDCWWGSLALVLIRGPILSGYGWEYRCWEPSLDRIYLVPADKLTNRNPASAASASAISGDSHE